MQTNLQKDFIQAAKVIAIGLVLGLGIGFAHADWTAPLHTPPTCNAGEPGCDAPINVSTTGQTKGSGTDYVTFLPQGGSSSLSVSSSAGIGINVAKGGIQNIGGLLNDGTLLQAGTALFGIDPNGFFAIGFGGPVGAMAYDNSIPATFYTPVQIKNTLQVADGTQGASKVLTSDANGNASWQTPAQQSLNIPIYAENEACVSSDSNGMAHNGLPNDYTPMAISSFPECEAAVCGEDSNHNLLYYNCTGNGYTLNCGTSSQALCDNFQIGKIAGCSNGTWNPGGNSPGC
jgi:hypothetical protein